MIDLNYNLIKVPVCVMLNPFQGLYYHWENYFTVIDWEQGNLSLIFYLH